MLELRPNCECCDVDLPPDSLDARICTFECTFCAGCVDEVLGGVCPNCGGTEFEKFNGDEEKRAGRAHVAFTASSQKAVDAWYKNAVYD